MGLNDSHAINLQVIIFKSGTDLTPQLDQITLAVFGCVGFCIPIVVKLHLGIGFAEGARRMVFGRRGDGDKQAFMPVLGSGFLDTGDHRH
ncbi:hypothetical protein D3C78_1588970 [compost metagenome]